MDASLKDIHGLSWLQAGGERGLALSELELDLLLEGIFRAYHYDFRSYARSSLRRRVSQAMASMGCRRGSELLDNVLHDPAAFARLLSFLTIQVSDLFRDPPYWRALREQVVPHLSTYARLRIWIAGCGAGEEAYSMAILLSEEGLLERCQIYATDIDDASLRQAAEGVYRLERLRLFSENYFAAGGRASLSDYYSTGSSYATVGAWLRKRILFSDHCLATDAAFAETQLISCRNVLICFDSNLQKRAMGLFRDSLCPRGFLGLGSHESVDTAGEEASFEGHVAAQKIYRLRAAQ